MGFAGSLLQAMRISTLLNLRCAPNSWHSERIFNTNLMRSSLTLPPAQELQRLIVEILEILTRQKF